jgi:DNA repair protein RadA
MPTIKDMDNAIEEMQNILRMKNGGCALQTIESFKKNKTIQPDNNDEDEVEELNGERIKTNTIIDEMIGGGIGVGESMMLYGAPASGKTQTVMTAVALCPNFVLYIDCENSFSWKRLKQICKERNIDYEEKKKKIIKYTPTTWGEQLLIMFSIPHPEEMKNQYGENAKVDLIICDSLIDLFRVMEFNGRQSLPIRSGFLTDFLHNLVVLSKLHKASVLYTNQITTNPVAGPYVSISDQQKPCGGPTVEHKPTYNLFFRKSVGNVRIARMMDSSFNELCERAFIINEKGIDDLPEQAVVSKRLSDSTKKFDDKQSQETIVVVKKAKGAKEVTESDIAESVVSEEAVE